MMSACRLPMECKKGCDGGMTSYVILRYLGTHSKNSDDDMPNPETCSLSNPFTFWRILKKKSLRKRGKIDVILWGNLVDSVLWRDDSPDTLFAVPEIDELSSPLSLSQLVGPVVQPLSFVLDKRHTQFENNPCIFGCADFPLSSIQGKFGSG